MNVHKAGFVSIIGSPNVGKSTLVNALMGEKLAISTHKAQTTRHRIMGMLNGTDYQIVFSDTPGIVKPHYALHENMMDVVNSSFLTTAQIIVVINKGDLLSEAEVETKRTFWQEKFKKAEIRIISALHHIHTLKLLERIKELLPVSPAFFPKEEFTDKSSRFFASEMIRKQLFIQLSQEIPYACEVIVEAFKEEAEITKIRSVIYVERASQKGILIGKGGCQITKIGSSARKEMESFFEAKIFLDLKVKVLKNWRNNKNQLKKFGYNTH